MFVTTATTAVAAAVAVQVRPVSDEGRRSSSDGTATVEHVGGAAARAGGGASQRPPLYRGGIFGARIGVTHFPMESTTMIHARISKLISPTLRRRENTDMEKRAYIQYRIM
jgi:hypothetical protein